MNTAINGLPYISVKNEADTFAEVQSICEELQIACELKVSESLYFQCSKDGTNFTVFIATRLDGKPTINISRQGNSTNHDPNAFNAILKKIYIKLCECELIDKEQAKANAKVKVARWKDASNRRLE